MKLINWIIGFLRSERYRNLALHFGVFCGIITIVSLIMAFYSYDKTIKPYIDEERYKNRILELEVNNNEMTVKNQELSEQIEVQQNELRTLEAQSEKISEELIEKKDKLDGLEEELVLAYAGSYMTPIIYQTLYDSIYQSENDPTVKEYALEELVDESQKDSLNNYQKKALNILIDFVKQELDNDSSFEELFSYHIYIYDKQLDSLKSSD